MREVVDIREIVGTALSHEIYWLDHVFRDVDLMGGVGMIYRPVMRSEYDATTSPDGLQRHLERWWTDSCRRGDTRTIGAFASNLYADKGDMSLWDSCSPEVEQMLRSYTGTSVKSAPIFTCCGGGIVFDRRIAWRNVSNFEQLFMLLDLDLGRMDAWDYFVKRA